MPSPSGAAPATLDHLVGRAFARRIEAAAEAVRASKDEIRIVVDADADGLSAGGILVRALTRAGKRFHLSGVKGIDTATADALRASRPAFLITADLGSGQADLLESLAQAGTTVVILDHHVPITKRDDASFFQINGHLHGVDGTSELCGASTSFLFAIALSPSNFDLVPLAISGAIGDRQHVGGFRGAAQRILEAGAQGGFFTVHRGLNLDGRDVLDALVNSNDPFLPGVTGDEAAARRLLRDVGVRPEAAVDSLEDRETKALASRLVALLLENRVEPLYAEEVTTERVLLAGGGPTAKELQALINSAGRSGEASVAVAVAMGDQAAVERARKLGGEYRRQVRAGLLKLAANPPKKLKAVQYFDTDNPLVAAAVAGLGVIYLFDPAFPVVSFTPGSDGGWKVSTRATRGQLARGVDFSVAARRAAESVGGRGGGHPVASGATIPKDARERFLASLDAIVAEQLAVGRPVAAGPPAM
jgi:single-stranded-DNA-specific exonuclease